MAGKFELNKEEMFRKLIPSADDAKPAEASPIPEASSGGMMSDNAIAAAFTAAQETSEPEPQPAPQPEASVQPMIVDEAPSAPPSPFAPGTDAPASIAHSVPPPVVETNGSLPHPINRMELIMEKYYPIYLQRYDGCACERCKDDVLGIALNKVKPHYVSSDQLSEVEIANRALVAEAVTAIVKALLIVKRNPNHNNLTAMRK